MSMRRDYANNKGKVPFCVKIPIIAPSAIVSDRIANTARQILPELAQELVAGYISRDRALRHLDHWSR